MADKYIGLVSGQLTEIEATVVSAGAGDAGELVALDGGGKLDISVLPTGVGADTKVMATSENLTAGEFVNVYNNAGTITARKADASNGRRAHGFVLAGTTSPANATVYFDGTNNQVSGFTPGATVYLSGSSAGDATETPVSTAGYISQEIGTVLSSTEITFEPASPITLA